MDVMQVLEGGLVVSLYMYQIVGCWEESYKRPTAKMAKTPILRFVGSLSFEMR